MASIGGIIGGGARVIRDRPVSTLAWGGLYFLGLIAIGLFIRWIGLPLIEVSSAGQLQVPLLTRIVIELLVMALMTVVFNAIYRALLRPYERDAAGLRAGPDELRIMGLRIIVSVVMFVAWLIVALIAVMLTSFFGFVSGGEARLLDPLMFALLALVAALAIWLFVRLSPIFPLTLYRRKITVDGAWELTRGRFWKLFVAYLATGLFCIALIIAVIWPYFGGFILALFRSGGDPMMLAQAQYDLQQHVHDMPTIAHVGFLIAIFLASVVTVVLGAAIPASATRELLLDVGEDPDAEPEEELY